MISAGPARGRPSGRQALNPADAYRGRGRPRVAFCSVDLCRDDKPHKEHAQTTGLHTFFCPGRPQPDSPQGRVWEAIYSEVLDGLHGDASGLDDGVAGAVDRLQREGLLIDGRLREAAIEEQAYLWEDMQRMYAAGYRSGSGGMEGVIRRIIALAKIVGATPWSQVQVDLLLNGHYERVLKYGGLAMPEPIDWERVAYLKKKQWCEPPPLSGAVTNSGCLLAVDQV